MSSTYYSDLCGRIKGPVYPIPPAFKKDMSVDYLATAAYVEYLVSQNVRTLMTTAGTSRFNLLTDEEIILLNKTIVEAAQGKAFTIAANHIVGSTMKAIEFSKIMEGIGADALLLYYPERYYGDDAVFEYVKSVASNTKAGVMVHTTPMKNARIGTPSIFYSLDLCKRLKEIENVIGIKEESRSQALRLQLGRYIGERFAIVVAGAAMRSFMGCHHFGINAYLCGVGSFTPKVEEDFYNAMINNELNRALEIMATYETPFFDVAFPMGWHIAMKGALDLLGLMPDFERLPLMPATSSEKEKLKVVLRCMGWL